MPTADGGARFVWADEPTSACLAPQSRPELLEVKTKAWCTHPSATVNLKARFEVPEDLDIDDYERLEFAGDKVLGWVVAELIIERYPRLTEGASTMILSQLVCEETLSLFARDYDLISRLRAGPYQRSSLIVNPRIQCDIFEAYVGALQAERGYEVVRDWLRVLFAPMLDEEYTALKLKLSRVVEVKSEVRDLSVAVQGFNELCQKMRLTPSFRFEADGPPHSRTFMCWVTVGAQQSEGMGTTKKAAKHDALARMAMLYGV